MKVMKQYEWSSECIMKSKQQEDLELIVDSDVDFKKYSNKTVFITGATGLIGSSLVKVFLCANRKKECNIHIVAVVRDKIKAEKQYGNLLDRADLELYVGDIIDPLYYDGNIDYIFHAASVTASKIMVEHPVMTIETAYRGTCNILDLAKSKDVKGVVYISSMEVYGKPDKELDYVGEKDLGYIDLGNVRSSYSEGKRICECLCTAYAAEYHVPVKIARLAQTFGAGILESDNRVYVQFAKSVIENKDIVLHTDGISEGNYCYIRDVVKALLLLGYEGAVGESYNIVNENTHMRIREMATLVAEKLAGGKIRVVFDIPESALQYGYAPAVKIRLCGAKMRSLGWNPEVDLQEMYERMIYDMRLKDNYRE